MRAVVTVPTRIRSHAYALTSTPGEVDDAVADVLDRVLTNASQVVPWSDAAKAMITVPAVTWSGDGATEVQPRVRANVESRLSRLWLDAVRRALAPGPPRATAKPYQGEMSELVDAARYDDVREVYVVPSYRGGKTAVRVAKKPKPPQSALWGWRWRTITTGATLLDELRRELRRRMRSLPSSGYLAAMFLSEAGTYYIFSYEFPSATLVLGLELKRKGRLRPQLKWDGNKSSLELVPVDIAPDEVKSIRYYGSGASEAEQREVFHRVYDESVKHLLVANASKTELTTGLEVESETKRRAEAFVDDMLTKARADTKIAYFLYLDLVDGGTLIWMDEPARVPESFLAEVIPLAERVPVTAEDKDIVIGVGGGEEGDPSAKPKGQSERYGFVYTEMERVGLPKTFPDPVGASESLTWDAFDHEPKLSELGQEADGIRALIKDIATMLEMKETGQYAARFAINAARVLQSRVGAVGDHAMTVKGETNGYIKPIDPRNPNLGATQFVAPQSVAIQSLRLLGKTMPLITHLRRVIYDVYSKAITDERAKRLNTWNWHLESEFYDWMVHAGAALFATTCRVLLYQMLKSSAQGIAERQTPGYAEIFERTVKPRLVRVVELTDLRDRLKDSRATVPLKYLPEAKRAQEHASAPVFGSVGSEMIPVKIDPGYVWPDVTENAYSWDAVAPVAIRDAKGRVWKLPELETAMVVRRGAAETADPLVKQLLDLPMIVGRFQTTTSIRMELDAILKEMAGHNKDKQKSVRDDWLYAFKATRAARVQNFDQLAGIHHLAHEQLVDFVKNDPYYAVGVQGLIGMQLMKEELGGALLFGGLVALSMVSAGVAFIVGLGLAFEQKFEATEHEQLYKSLLDPEQVRTRVEIDAEQFTANLGVVLAFIPVVPKLFQGFTRGASLLTGRAAEAAAAEEAAATVASHAAAPTAESVLGGAFRLTAEALATIERSLTGLFLTELVKAEMFNLAISTCLADPMIERLVKERRITGPVGGLEGSWEAVMQLPAASGLRPGKPAFDDEAGPDD